MNFPENFRVPQDPPHPYIAVPVGPLTVTNPSAIQEVTVIDLHSEPLTIFPGESVDMGKWYTQKQICDSKDLRERVTRGELTVAATGTAPKKEPVDAIVTINPGDIQIGAVEIKDWDSEDRLDINSDHTASVRIIPFGDPVHDYNTVASVAKDATSNHDYTVTTGKTLVLEKIWATASGKMKIEVQIETTGFATKFVGFNSVSSPNMDITIPAGMPINVAATKKVRIIRTNLDNSSQALYSSVVGKEI